VEERVAFLDAHGLDFVVVLPFTREVAATSARDFTAPLSAQLRLSRLWVGPDFALGRGREGTPDRLAEIGRELGYEVRIVEAFHDLGGPVHSSRIRGLLTSEGLVDEAAALLGRPYQVWGEVVRGAGRGHDLGFPTANLDVRAGRVVPANGIYACWAWLGEEGSEGHPAAVSIGVRPTFDNGERKIEAYLLDLPADLYGERLGLSFIRRLRPELRFPNADALIAQMEQDVTNTRAILGGPRDDAGPATQEAMAWEELPHTADWAIRVQAATQRELFERAAAAMYELQDADLARPVELARAVSAEGGDPAELLVAWLNRLLAQQEAHGEMYTRFELHDLSPCGLLATAYGYHGTPAHTAVKAVTFWDLDVHQTETGWTATLTFDV
jgi:riboflavin kinase/FMN adenylyltransferase